MKPKLLNGKVNKAINFESIIIKILKIFFMKVKFSFWNKNIVFTNYKIFLTYKICEDL